MFLDTSGNNNNKRYSNGKSSKTSLQFWLKRYVYNGNATAAQVGDTITYTSFSYQHWHTTTFATPL
jgi:plastocyanin